MNRIALSLLLAAATLAGCAQLQPQAEGGASAYQAPRPFPKSSSDLGLF
jgi:hypothetical protein